MRSYIALALASMAAALPQYDFYGPPYGYPAPYPYAPYPVYGPPAVIVAPPPPAPGLLGGLVSALLKDVDTTEATPAAEVTSQQ